MDLLYWLCYAQRCQVPRHLVGNGEAERRFNYFVNKYSKIKALTSHFTLIEDQYDPGSTWVCCHVARIDSKAYFYSTRKRPSWYWYSGLAAHSTRVQPQLGYMVDPQPKLALGLTSASSAQVPEYDCVAKKAIELLNGPVDEVPSEDYGWALTKL